MQPSQSVTAGSTLATQPVIYEEDQFGNLLTGDNTTSVTAYLGSGNGPLQGTLSATVTGGIARFAGLADQAAGTISLLFTGAGLTSIPSVPIVIGPAMPTSWSSTPSRRGPQRPGNHLPPSPSSGKKISLATW